MSHQLRSDAPDRIFLVSSRVNWRAWHLAGEKAKLLLARLLREAAEAYGVRILAGVLMSNHLHLVVQSPPPALFRTLTGRRLRCRHFYPYPAGHQNASVIAQFMKSVRYRMSVRWQKELELSGKFWDSHYDARPVESLVSLVVRIAYVHRNPVKASMVSVPEDYPWSSAAEWRTGAPGLLPISPLWWSVFDTPPELVRANVLEYQRCQLLDQHAEEIGQRLRLPVEAEEGELRCFLEEHGFPPVRGADSADR